MSIWDKFQRVSSQEYMPQIDGLRFLAILTVALMHFRTSFIRNSGIYTETSLNGHNLLNDILLTGGVGVQIFFVISGFMLAIPFAKSFLGIGKEICLKNFFFRRLTRIEPPYIITLLILFLVHIVLHTASLTILFEHLFASIIYSHSLIYHARSFINPVAWALEIEIQFYILVPLLTRIFCIKKINLRRGLIIISILFFVVLKNIYTFSSLTIVYHAHYFLVGFLLADFYLSTNQFKFKPAIFDVLGFIGIVFIFISRFNGIEIFVVISIFVVFTSAFKGNIFKQFLSFKLFSIIGGMSYITFLIHYPLAMFFNKLFHKFIPNVGFEFDLLVMSLFIIPLIFITSSLSFLILEKPFMYFDWPQKFKKLCLEKCHIRCSGSSVR